MVSKTNLFFDNMTFELKITWNPGSLRNLVLSYGTFCFQIGDFCPSLGNMSNNFNLVALLCSWCIFYFISNPDLDFRGAWCTLLFLIVALGQQLEQEVELNTETLVCPEGRIELWVNVPMWQYFSIEKIPKFKVFIGYINFFF